MQRVSATANTRAALVAGIALLWAAGSALADEPTPSDRPPPSKEMREQMAKAHDAMAACLRSDRPIDECHSEMMKNHGGMHHRPKTEQTSTRPPAQ